jgi:two-component system, NtrC family, phosphoglycerate transport system sensor histidine kinase PgtB
MDGHEVREIALDDHDIAIRPSPPADRINEKPIRFGFGGRLLLAFGAVAVMTVVAGLVAWLGFATLSNAIERIQVRHLPAISIAADLAEKGGAIISMAPQLIAVQTENEREQIWSELQVILKGMRRMSRTHLDVLAQDETVDRLQVLIDRIEKNLVGIDNQVHERFVLEDLQADLTDRLRWFHTDFLEEIDPMVDDARFNLTSALGRIEAARQQAEVEGFLDILREETRKQEAMLKINASGNLVVGLLVRGSSAPDAKTLEDTVHFHGEVAALLKEDLAQLAGLASGISLQQICDEIIAFGQGEGSVFAVRRGQLAVIRDAQTLLERNRNLVEQLKIVIAAQIRTAQASSVEAVQNSYALIGRGKMMLISVMMASLAVAILVGWLYVGGNLVARVTALSQSMRAISHGDLKAPIPTGGRDEIAIMADALLVFRDTAIAVEEANAQAIIDNARAGLLTTDESGRIEFFNPTAMALFGYHRSYNPTRHINELVLEDRRHVIDAFLHSSREKSDENLLSLEITGRRSDGSTFPAEIAICAFHQRQQKKFLVTVYDATERKQTQDELENRVRERTADLHRAIEQLQQEILERRHAEAVLKETQADLVQAAKLAALGQMAAGIAHELNQPLAAIRSYIHNAGRLIDMQRSEEAVGVLARVTLLTERMANISKHLRNLARRPSDRMRMVDLKKAIENALALFESRLQKEGVVLSLELPEAPCTVYGEEVRLEQVCVNLISNALDAMQHCDRKELVVSVNHVSEQYLELTVKDTGTGIAADDLERIFDPFYTTKEVGQGLGLGLSITYNIIKDWGGAIQAANLPGKGAAFVLNFNTH